MTRRIQQISPYGQYRGVRSGIGLVVLSIILCSLPSSAQMWNPGQNNNNNFYFSPTSTTAPEKSLPTSTSISIPRPSATFDAPFPSFADGFLASKKTILMAHAITACLAWAFLIPFGGLLLRLNIDSPWMLRLHIVVQITSVLLYTVAVALGICLIISFGTFSASMWNDVHPRLGMAILALTILQPVLGYSHHRIFKNRLMSPVVEQPGKTPGRTVWAHLHLWLGRSLIALGIVNGGLGIKLARSYPATNLPNNHAPMFGYIAGVIVVMVIYIAVVVVFEWRKARGRVRSSGTSNSDELPFASWRKYPHF